jgi:hypothetical protein
MTSHHANSTSDLLGRVLQQREAVLLTFCDPLPAEYARLLHLSRKEWESLLRWLDTSGLALYFLDRVEELGLAVSLPQPVIVRLRKNRTDNAKRIEGMIAESAAIQRRFQEAQISYAVLKGFSLWPISVPKLQLRSQLDLDFLIAKEGAMKARKILEDFGYRLDIVSDGNMDFKVDERRASTLDDLYKAGVGRTAELHIEAVSAGRTSMLSRTQKQCFHGTEVSVLSPRDLFLGQGLHLYKHVCSQFSRAAHLIEFRRHVIARRDDNAFWAELQELTSGEPAIGIRLGVVIHLITRVMGEFAPPALTRWTVDPLPASARLWVEIYGRRTVLATFPGSKLYLLLEAELEAEGLPAKRSRWQALVPRKLPRSITRAVAGETLSARMERHYRQLLYNSFRLRFSTFEGIRYLRESILWRQYRNGVSQ